MSKATKTTMEDLHGLVAEELGIRLSQGDWQASDMSAAIKFLRDNGVVNPLANSINQLEGVVEGLSEEDLPESLRLVK
jgi:hypothetical protein